MAFRKAAIISSSIGFNSLRTARGRIQESAGLLFMYPLDIHTIKAKQVTYSKNLSIYKAARNVFITAYGLKTSVHIHQMGIDAMLYADMAKESISKAIGKPNEQSTLDAIPQIREILSDSVLIGIERIAHTGNKGTALYGYRLYNLYWYDDGQKKTPNCLVCTVVQSTDSAEGYVFHNIENVTVEQDLPGNKTGMPPSLNSNIYTVAQLYKTVKKIDRGNGGLKYTDAEKDKYLFAYTERRDGAKYSDRDYSYEALTSKPDMVVTTVDGNVPKNRADVVAMAKKNAAKVGKFEPKTGSVSVHVDDIEKDVVIGTVGLKHGLEGRRTENAIVTLKAGEILRNSIRINELTPKREEADSSYILIGVAKSNNGDFYIVRSVVNTFKHELISMDVLYAINAKKGNRLRSMRPGFQGPVTDSTISIAELLDYVNQYFPDILPEDVLKHYGYDARPDGDV